MHTAQLTDIPGCSYRTTLTGRVLALLLATLIMSCISPSPGPEVKGQERESLRIRTLPTSELAQQINTAEGQRMLADLLFAGLQALDNDRLLTPLDDNAHARFQRVLAYDPDNAIALRGLQDIVARYLELASEASRQGLFDEAGVLLDRARFVDEEHPGIVTAARELQIERDSGDLFFSFDSSGLAARSDAVRNQLVQVAQQARQHEAFFLITAPTDEQGRWMFSIMKEAVPGYRLRGNIELAGRAGIRLRMPQEP